MAENYTQWYYLDHNWRGLSVIRGPFTTSQLEDLLRSGEISIKTRVRYGQNTLWRPMEDVPALAGLVREASAKRRVSELWRRYGAVIVIVILMILAATFARMRSSGESFGRGESNRGSSQETLTKEAVISLTNNARIVNGLPALKENPLLDAIATSRARDMFEKQYFAHISPTGQGASDIAQGVGYRYKIISENIGSGNFYSNQKVVDGWMQSPGHRRNILSQDVEEIGVAVMKGSMKGAETYVAVQIFGLQSLPVAQHSCVAPSKSLLDEIEAKKAEIASLNGQLDRLKQELSSEKETIEADRRFTDGDPQRIQSLNVKVGAYNEKSTWYNRLLTDAKAKTIVQQSMIDEYNRMGQAYNDCRMSK